MGFVINPGSGPVEGANAAQAARAMQQFVHDLSERGITVGSYVRNEDADYDADDHDGRFAFDLAFADGRTAQVQMPGLPVDQVRWLGPDQDIWQFPRLYVDDSSWVWFFALNACHPDRDTTPEVTNPGTVVSLHVIADRPSFGAGGRCPECGAELVTNTCTSGVCPSASCHECGYGCDLFTDGAGKCVMALRAKSPMAGGEQ